MLDTELPLITDRKTRCKLEQSKMMRINYSIIIAMLTFICLKTDVTTFSRSRSFQALSWRCKKVHQGKSYTSWSIKEEGILHCSDIPFSNCGPNRGGSVQKHIFIVTTVILKWRLAELYSPPHQSRSTPRLRR
jgi:hypothetical protein